jgi:transaldolase
MMELYLDTANLAEIREIADWGILSGVTTNPSLLAKAGINVKDFMAEIASLVTGPLSLEVTAEDADTMVEQAKFLKTYGENVVIKLPLTEAGLKACGLLKKAGIPTNLTLVFSANQALLAARAGATYVSPFVGRLNDNGAAGNLLLEEIRAIFDRYQQKTKIIAASIRSPRDVTDAALFGADIATIPYGVMKKMVKHPLTDVGLAQFKADWEKSGLCL